MNLSSVDCVSNLWFPTTHPRHPGKIWFDFDGFAALLVKYKVPATRAFSWVVPWLDAPADRAAVIPYVYDAKQKKYDLDRVREEWIRIVEYRINGLADAGVIVIVSLDDHCARTGSRNWRNHPQRLGNNKQGFGPEKDSQAAWTGPDGHPDAWLKYVRVMWDLYQQVIPPRNRKKIRYELTNEPVNPDYPWRLLLWLQDNGVPRTQIWASVTPRNRKRCFFEPGHPRAVWGKPEVEDLRKGVSVLSIHQCGAIAEADVYCGGRSVGRPYEWLNEHNEGDYVGYSAKLRPSLIVRPDNDGSSTPSGDPLWKAPVNGIMVPYGGVNAVATIRARYGSNAFLALADDNPKTPGQWRATWKTLEPYCKALGDAP